MEDSENRKFENEWQKAFADSEGEVNPSVWANIDAKLATIENGAMKKRVVFYQWLAAASVVFALAIGGVFLLRPPEGDSLSLSTQRTNATNEQPSTLPPDAQQQKNELNDSSQSRQLSIENKTPSADRKLVDEASVAKKLASVQAVSSPPAANHKLMRASSDVVVKSKSLSSPQGVDVKQTGDTSSPAEIGEEKINTIDAPVAAANEKSTALPTTNEAKSSTDSLHYSIASILNETDTMRAVESPIKIAKIDTEPPEEEPVKELTSDKWFASLLGAAGSYVPNNGTPAATSQVSGFAVGSSPSTNSPAPQVGIAYSFGVNFGKRIAPKWVLMSGVGYMNQSVNYTAASAVFNATQAQTFTSSIAKANVIQAITSYELNSVNEFVTIPLQAGYVLVNKKVGLQINAGVSGDIFIRNTLTDPSGRLASNVQSAGEGSSYKTLNWTGLFGTELSYKISSHYRFSIIPGVRYSFDSILKSDTGTSITPTIWDVGFRFKYVF